MSRPDCATCRAVEGDGPYLVGSVAPLSMVIAVGFGEAAVYHDGELVIDGERALLGEGPPVRVRDAEKRARRSPRGEWRVVINGPLWSAAWLRARPGKWVCTSVGRGFA
jgi:hypothetical protein